MAVKRVHTRRGITLQDETTGKLAGSIGIGKDNAPTPGLSDISTKHLTQNARPETVDKLAYRHVQYQEERLRLKLEREAAESEEITEVEEWDIIDISPELVIQRNQELNLEEYDPSKQVKQKTPEKTYSRNSQPKPKKTKKKKTVKFRLDMEKYGPNWMEVNKFISLASSLEASEIKKISAGRTNADFITLVSNSRLDSTEKQSLIRAGKTELRAVRKLSHKLLQSLDREVAIVALLEKTPNFTQDLLIVADALLGLVLRDKIVGTESYDVLTRAWRVRFGKVHPDDAELRK